MANTRSRDDEFAALMEAVNALKAHYKTVTGAAEEAMLIAKLRGRDDEAARFARLLDSMSDERRKALGLIGERLTTPEKLRETRRAVRAAADEALGFVKRLKEVKMKLETLASAANFLSELVRGLTRIVA
jgi:hypothetical protein